MRIEVIGLAMLGLVGVFVAGVSPAAAVSRVSTPPVGMPIQHIVIIFQENHTFDNLFGNLCTQQANRCNGVTTGKVGATTIPLAPTPDIVPPVDHSVAGQVKATDGGLMDGFHKINGCTAPTYGCYTVAPQSEIPNLWGPGHQVRVQRQHLQSDTDDVLGSAHAVGFVDPGRLHR